MKFLCLLLAVICALYVLNVQAQAPYVPPVNKPAAAPAAAPAANPNAKKLGKEIMTKLIRNKSAKLWATTLSPKAKTALEAYRSNKRVGTGLVYGESVKTLNLVGKNHYAISQHLVQKYRCKVDNQFIKDPKTNQPIVVNGKQIPMVTYICPDGGAVRVKPQGDPTNARRPQPLSVKALRWPHNGPFNTFDDELLKVEGGGALAIPKWFKDMNTAAISTDKAVVDAALDAWADLAHTNLKSGGLAPLTTPPAAEAAKVLRVNKSVRRVKKAKKF